MTLIQGNDALKGRIEAKLTQRQGHPFGFLFTPNGDFDVDTSSYPGLVFEVVPLK